MARIALLAGLFVVPAALLWLGHRLRDRSPLQRGAFWGGLVGHTFAMIGALIALHYPPVPWTGDARAAVVFWLMPLGGIVGALVGAARNRR